MAAAVPVPRKPAQRQRSEAQEWADSDRFNPIPFVVKSGAAAGMTRAELIIYVGTLEERYCQQKREVVISKATMAEWSGESPKEVQRAASHLAEVGVLPRRRLGNEFAYGHCAERLDRLKVRKPRYGYVAPPKPIKEEAAEVEIPRKQAGHDQPASLSCPLGAECPVDRLHTRADGVLVNLPSPREGAASGGAVPSSVKTQEVTVEGWTPVSTLEVENGRRKGETKWTPVSTLANVHHAKVCEEKAKVDPLKRQELAEWMAHEGRKRGRCGVGPTEMEIRRVYEELGKGTVAELQDYAAHKIHFMRRYTWLYPFARTVGRRAAAHGNGHAKAPPTEPGIPVPWRDADGNLIPWEADE